jgi:hypothetical protein
MCVENQPSANIAERVGITGRRPKQQLEALGEKLSKLRSRLGNLDTHVSKAIDASAVDTQEVPVEVQNALGQSPPSPLDTDEAAADKTDVLIQKLANITESMATLEKRLELVDDDLEPVVPKPFAPEQDGSDALSTQLESDAPISPSASFIYPTETPDRRVVSPDLGTTGPRIVQRRVSDQRTEPAIVKKTVRPVDLVQSAPLADYIRTRISASAASLDTARQQNHQSNLLNEFKKNQVESPVSVGGVAYRQPESPLPQVRLAQGPSRVLSLTSLSAPIENSQRLSGNWKQVSVGPTVSRGR